MVLSRTSFSGLESQDAVLEALQDQYSQEDAGNTAGQEEPMPSPQAQKAIQTAQDQTGNRTADKPGTGGRKEHVRGDPTTIGAGEPERHEEENARRKPG